MNSTSINWFLLSLKVQRRPRVSKVKVDKLRNKCVEMTIPPPYIDLDKVHPTDYVIKMIDLGKKTHQGIVEDAQASFQHVVAMFNEEKIKQDKLKKHVALLIDVLIKITKSLEVADPITSFLESMEH